MGTWSRLAGMVFLDWLAPRSGLRWITASMVRPLARAVPSAIVPIVAIVPMMAMMSVVAVMRLLDEAWLAAVDTGLGHLH